MFSSSYKRLHCPSGMKLSLLPFRVRGQHRGARDSKYCAALPDCHQGAMTKGHSGPVLDLFALHPVQKGLWIPQTCNTSHPHDAVPFLKCLLSAKEHKNSIFPKYPKNLYIRSWFVPRICPLSCLWPKPHTWLFKCFFWYIFSLSRFWGSSLNAEKGYQLASEFSG